MQTQQPKLPESAAREFFEELAEEADRVCGRPIDDQVKEAIRSRTAHYLGFDDVSLLNVMKTAICESVGAGRYRLHAAERWLIFRHRAVRQALAFCAPPAAGDRGRLPGRTPARGAPVRISIMAGDPHEPRPDDRSPLPPASRLRAAAPGLATGGVIVLFWLAAASRWIVTDAVVPWDSKNQFYAFFRFLASALHSGSTPFWNPYHYGGHPAVADPQSLIFAPAFVAWALIDPAPSMRAFDLLVYAHLLVGGLCVGAIGRRAGWPALACVLAAAVFMFGGAASARLQHSMDIVVYGLFPLALLLMQLALDRSSFAIGFAFAGAAAVLALGRNQVALLFCYALAAAALAEILAARQPWRYLRERFTLFVAMGVTALTLIAAPLLLTIQFAALSNRPLAALARAYESSLYPANLALLAVADIFGSHTPKPWGPNWMTEPAVSATDESFNYLFVGVVPVVLLLWFGIAGGRAARRGRRFLALLIVLSLAFMLGRYTPLFRWAFELVPGIDLFRRPVDASFVFVAALAPMTGFLLADYLREGAPPARLLRFAAVLACALGVVVWAVVFSGRSGRSGDALFEALKVAPLAAFAIAALALARTPNARRVAAFGVTLIAIGELFFWNVASRLNAEPRAAYAVLENPTPGEAAAMQILSRALAARHAQGERPRVEIMGLGGPWQNLAMVRGFEAINGYNPLRIGFYDRLVSPGETTYLAEQRTFPPSFPDYDCALARALGLEYVVLDRPIAQAPHLAHRAVAEALLAGPDVWIYRLRRPSPRLAFTRRVQVADAEATDAEGGLRAAPSPDRVLIDDDTAPLRAYGPLLAGAGVPAGFSASAGRVRMVSWRADRVEIAVRSSSGGVLVLHDSYYPGWIAEIDGKRTRILRADLLFRAVEMPAGAHRVVFRYAPFSLENLEAAFLTALGRPPPRP